MTETVRTRVILVGAGPAGLVMALELGRRAVPTVLIEEDDTTLRIPKANATTARTMEHFRRLGFAREVRTLGLPEDYPQDVAYFTRFSGYELARLPGASRGEAQASRASATSRWPTPEPLHRAQQMFIEPLLLEQVRKHRAVELRLGWRAVKVERTTTGVAVDAVSVADETPLRLEADYLVGCEGPRSPTRAAMGVGYEGLTEEDREFMGGRMLSIHFQAPDFYRTTPHRNAWQYWAFNPERRGVSVAIDGKGEFGMAAQLRPGQTPSNDFASRCIAQTMGRNYPHRILAMAQWTAGYTLVAEALMDRPDDPRLFLVGDSAHLFTPTGGQGYNTAVDDAANLGWKLAAVCAGWGGRALLTSYEAERKPIAHRNVEFARAMAESIGRMPVPPNIEAEGDAAEAARLELGRKLREHAEREFDIPGIHFGVCYAASPLTYGAPEVPPPDDWHHYTPHATPGARAPHLWVAPDVALFDVLGSEFTLLRLGAAIGSDTSALKAAADAYGIPLEIVDLPSDDARDIYARDFVLIRPDHHVAWRGNALPADVGALLARVTGHE